MKKTNTKTKTKTKTISDKISDIIDQQKEYSTLDSNVPNFKEKFTSNNTLYFSRIITAILLLIIYVMFSTN